MKDFQVNQTDNSRHNLDEIADFITKLARQAGEIVLRERLQATYETRFKDNEELVTSADVKVDEFI